MAIELLQEVFPGTGEVQGFTFRKKAEYPDWYIYEVFCDESGKSHYEVVARKATSKCIDFTNKVFSTEEFKETYPKSRTFGKDGFTYQTLEQALQKVEKLTNA